MKRKVILFEHNEVPFRVIDDFVARNPASTFAQFQATGYEYDALCEDKGHLDPWISWSSLHRGVNNAKHDIEHLGQVTTTVDRQYPPLWQIINGCGVQTGVFGSLFSSAVPADVASYAFYLPDYFASEAAGHPRSLKDFQELNLAMTRESALRVSRRVQPSVLKQFALNIPAWGVRAETLLTLAAQLVKECLDEKKKTRRRDLQSLIMFDIFVKMMDGTRPCFATFYTNHVAAAMHRYWAAAFPEDYHPHPFGAGWVCDFADEIRLAMRTSDRMLKRLKDFVDANPAYVLIVASSLGQGAIAATPTRSIFTITDLGKFLGRIGIDPGEWHERPSMVPCRSFQVMPANVDSVREKLLSLRLGDRPMQAVHGHAAPFGFDEREEGYFHVHVQYFDYAGDRTIRFGNEVAPAEAFGLGDEPTDHNVQNTAQHVPSGAMIIYDPAGRKTNSGRQEASFLDVVPSILCLLGITIPNYMDGRLLDFAR